MAPTVTVTVRQLAEWVRGELLGDGELPIANARTLAEAEPGDITFVEHDKHLAAWHNSKASAAIVPPSVPGPHVPPIPRTRTNSFSQPDHEPVILEPPVTTNPLLARPTLPPADIAAIRRLQDAGVPTLLAVAPIVPQITDHELETIVAAGAEAGARAAFYLPVRLPHEVAPLFRAWLDEHYPDRAAKVMATIQSLRGGKDKLVGYFVGQAMKATGGRADPARVGELVREAAGS